MLKVLLHLVHGLHQPRNELQLSKNYLIDTNELGLDPHTTLIV